MVSMSKNEVNLDNRRQVADEKAAPVLEYDEPLLIITLGDWVDDESDIPGGGIRQGYGYKREWLESSVRKQHYQEIGESTCSWWKLNEETIQRKGIEYVVAAYRGVTRALFRIKPGTWEFDVDDECGRRIGWNLTSSTPVTSSIKWSASTGTGSSPNRNKTSVTGRGDMKLRRQTGRSLAPM